MSIKENNIDVCFGAIETYQVTARNAPYTWNLIGGNIISGGTKPDNAIEVEWTDLTNSKVSIVIAGGCFNTNTAEKTITVITCSDLTITKEVDFIKPSIGEIITFFNKS
jgi:hypothetical protein